MTAQTSIRSRKPGRPKTGVTKTRPSITIDKGILKKAKKAAFSERVGLSAWIEKAVVEQLATVAEQTKKEVGSK